MRALFLLLAAGCFNDLPADGSLQCAAGARPCPGGFHCAADGRCWRDGHEPDLAFVPDDLSTSDDGGQAQTCALDGECASGFCTDGVCCDQRCLGQCQSCNRAGLCKTTPRGPAPPGRPACSGGGTACGSYCDGLGALACVHPISNITCGALCDGVCGGQDNCSTAGNCPGGYACNGAACRTSCSGNADCQSGYLCQSSMCVAQGELDCLDGADNNGDSLADCQDPTCAAQVLCVDDPGDELGVNVGGSCPPGYPSPLPLHQGLTAPSPCAGCNCQGRVQCPVSLGFSGGGNCNAPTVFNTNLNVTSGTSGSDTPCTAGPSPTPASVNVGGPSPVPASSGCMLSGTTTPPPISWTTSSKWCTGRSSATCGAGKRCVPKPAAGQTICARLPNGSACPAGYQVTQDTWFASVNDTRVCGSCGCANSGAVTPSCGNGASDSLGLYNDPTCALGKVTTAPGGNLCTALASGNRYIFTKSTAGVVFPSCTAPSPAGTATPSDPSLICCPTCSCLTPPCLGNCPAGNFCDGTGCVPCDSATFCGAACSPCAPLGDSCSAGSCKCGTGAACDPMKADNCNAGQCRCGTGPECTSAILGCLGGTCF